MTSKFRRRLLAFFVGHGSIVIVVSTVALAAVIHIVWFSAAIAAKGEQSIFEIIARLCSVIALPLFGLWIGRKTTLIGVKFSMRRALSYAFMLNLFAFLFAGGHHYFRNSGAPIFLTFAAAALLAFAVVVLALNFFHAQDMPAFQKKK